MTPLNKLRNLSDEYMINSLVNPVLEDPRFEYWSASSKRKDGQIAHHYGHGGLAQHTYEVVNIALEANKVLEKPVDERKIIIAGIYHDYGKIWDYEEVDGEWIKTEHYHMFHHIVRSVKEWERVAARVGGSLPVDEISHAIWAHHGRKEYGSPVTPQTQLAVLIHGADSISARMNDYNTLSR